MREADPASSHPASIMPSLVSAVQLRILHAFAGRERHLQDTTRIVKSDARLTDAVE